MRLKMEEASQCKARQPKRPERGMHGGRCGLPAGHRGPHTLLVPTQYPWSKSKKQAEGER